MVSYVGDVSSDVSGDDVVAEWPARWIYRHSTQVGRLEIRRPGTGSLSRTEREISYCNNPL